MILKFKKFLQNRLALKILISILLFGSILSVSTTFVQLYFDSHKNLKEVKKSITIIKETRLEPISLSLYNYNVSQLEIQLESLLNLPGIEYLKITEKGGFEKTVGTFDDTGERLIKETIDLQYIDASKRITALGKLEITAKLHNPYHRIYERLPALFITNSIKALITAILIFVIVQYLITRHLSSIASYASNVSMEKLDTPLSLKRKSLFFIKEDEFDQLIYAINNMRLRLKKDIEKQSEYETRLLRSEERLRQLVNATRDAVVVHENGKIIFANTQFYSMVGYEQDELKNVNIITKLMAPASSQVAMEKVSSKKLGHYEVVGYKKDETTFPAEIHTKIMEFHGREVRVASIRDITDYKKTQEEIAKLRNFLKSIIDSMPSFIAGVDPKGKVTEWNIEAEKLTGVSAK
ncbi:MAG: PAS domain S-box protein, partial [Desulfobacteraceae bacterium]|nr:PAS domain S-box protein [Desulfobacteraceae bacterium]